MNTQKIFNETDRNYLIELLVADRWQEANVVAKFLGFREGINAELFEKIIEKDGLNLNVIKAIATYYAAEIKGGN